MKRCNFVLTVMFNDGRTAELYNILGLKVATITEARAEAKRMVKEYIRDNSRFSEGHAKHWKNAKPYSMTYDNIEIVGKNKIFKSHGTVIF